MAPEIIDPPNSEYDSYTDCGYDMDVIPVTTRSDVYSFGMTALEASILTPPLVSVSENLTSALIIAIQWTFSVLYYAAL